MRYIYASGGMPKRKCGKSQNENSKLDGKLQEIKKPIVHTKEYLSGTSCRLLSDAQVQCSTVQPTLNMHPNGLHMQRTPMLAAAQSGRVQSQGIMPGPHPHQISARYPTMTYALQTPPSYDIALQHRQQQLHYDRALQSLHNHATSQNQITYPSLATANQNKRQTPAPPSHIIHKDLPALVNNNQISLPTSANNIKNQKPRSTATNNMQVRRQSSAATNNLHIQGLNSVSINDSAKQISHISQASHIQQISTSCNVQNQNTIQQSVPSVPVGGVGQRAVQSKGIVERRTSGGRTQSTRLLSNTQNVNNQLAHDGKGSSSLETHENLHNILLSDLLESSNSVIPEVPGTEASSNEPPSGQNVRPSEWIDDIDLAARVYIAFKLITPFEEFEKKFLNSLKKKAPSRTSVDSSSLRTPISTAPIDLTGEELPRKPFIKPKPLEEMIDKSVVCDALPSQACKPVVERAKDPVPENQAPSTKLAVPHSPVPVTAPVSVIVQSPVDTVTLYSEKGTCNIKAPTIIGKDIIISPVSLCQSTEPSVTAKPSEVSSGKLMVSIKSNDQPNPVTPPEVTIAIKSSNELKSTTTLELNEKKRKNKCNVEVLPKKIKVDDPEIDPRYLYLFEEAVYQDKLIKDKEIIKKQQLFLNNESKKLKKHKKKKGTNKVSPSQITDSKITIKNSSAVNCEVKHKESPLLTKTIIAHSKEPCSAANCETKPKDPPSPIKTLIEHLKEPCSAANRETNFKDPSSPTKTRTEHLKGVSSSGNFENKHKEHSLPIKTSTEHLKESSSSADCEGKHKGSPLPIKTRMEHSKEPRSAANGETKPKDPPSPIKTGIEHLILASSSANCETKHKTPALPIKTPSGHFKKLCFATTNETKRKEPSLLVKTEMEHFKEPRSAANSETKPKDPSSPIKTGIEHLIVASSSGNRETKRKEPPLLSKKTQVEHLKQASSSSNCETKHKTPALPIKAPSGHFKKLCVATINETKRKEPPLPIKTEMEHSKEPRSAANSETKPKDPPPPIKTGTEHLKEVSSSGNCETKLKEHSLPIKTSAEHLRELRAAANVETKRKEPPLPIKTRIEHSKEPCSTANCETKHKEPPLATKIRKELLKEPSFLNHGSTSDIKKNAVQPSLVKSKNKTIDNNLSDANYTTIHASSIKLIAKNCDTKIADSMNNNCNMKSPIDRSSGDTLVKENKQALRKLVEIDMFDPQKKHSMKFKRSDKFYIKKCLKNPCCVKLVRIPSPTFLEYYIKNEEAVTTSTSNSPSASSAATTSGIMKDSKNHLNKEKKSEKKETFSAKIENNEKNVLDHRNKETKQMNENVGDSSNVEIRNKTTISIADCIPDNIVGKTVAHSPLLKTKVNSSYDDSSSEHTKKNIVYGESASTIMSNQTVSKNVNVDVAKKSKEPRLCHENKNVEGRVDDIKRKLEISKHGTKEKIIKRRKSCGDNLGDSKSGLEQTNSSNKNKMNEKKRRNSDDKVTTTGTEFDKSEEKGKVINNLRLVLTRNPQPSTSVRNDSDPQEDDVKKQIVVYSSRLVNDDLKQNQSQKTVVADAPKSPSNEPEDNPMSTGTEQITDKRDDTSSDVGCISSVCSLVSSEKITFRKIERTSSEYLNQSNNSTSIIKEEPTTSVNNPVKSEDSLVTSISKVKSEDDTNDPRLLNIIYCGFESRLLRNTIDLTKSPERIPESSSSISKRRSSNESVAATQRFLREAIHLKQANFDSYVCFKCKESFVTVNHWNSHFCI